MTDANKNLNVVGFGPVLSGVVKTITIPIMANAMDAQINTFVAIFCIDLVYQLENFMQICSTARTR
jgi:hypothetical protein